MFLNCTKGGHFMQNDFQMVLGLEIHLQLKTDIKMFCSCKNDPFFSNANENICPVCTGLPGAMPIPNKNAISLAQKFACALNSDLNSHIIFERKNYFYPDLPKGFQITCPHYPIGTGGSLNGINFREIHLEEDTAKSIHDVNKTLIDFNKSGVPLLEIVTEPDFRSIEDAVDFCKEVQLVARYLGVSDADMEKGQMRLEANISVRKVGDDNLPNYRVEMKNINSFGFMKKALEYELRRQSEALRNGEKLSQETRGFDESAGKTFVQRNKEESNDYRYFPEPDIPPIVFDETDILEITKSIGELPSSVRVLLNGDNLGHEYIEVLVNNKNLLDIYFDLKLLGYAPSKSANFVINEAKYKGLSASEIDKLEKLDLSSKIDSADDLRPIVEKVILENEKVVEDYKSGNINAIQFLIRQVMKATNGKAEAKMVNDLILSVLKG